MNSSLCTWIVVVILLANNSLASLSGNVINSPTFSQEFVPDQLQFAIVGPALHVVQHGRRICHTSHAVLFTHERAPCRSRVIFDRPPKFQGGHVQGQIGRSVTYRDNLRDYFRKTYRGQSNKVQTI